VTDINSGLNMLLRCISKIVNIIPYAPMAVFKVVYDLVLVFVLGV